MTDTDLVARVGLLLDEQEAADLFSGTVLISHNDQPILETARGYAIHPKVMRNRLDTKFNIASVTKMLTATAVMRLVSEGKFDLHTPIAEHNPDLPYADQITIHQLLTHTAGFDRYWNDSYRAARSDLRTVAGYLELFAKTPLQFAPGTRHHYGNAGYVVLGVLIEQVMGISYYEYMRREIFQRAGMKNTDFYEMDLPIENCAVGYTRENWFGPVDGQLRSNHFIYAVKGSPSEHCFSTVQDLYFFFRALRTGRLLDPFHTNLCMTAHASAEQPGVSYGYGFHIIDDGKHGHVVGHGGRALGGDAFALMYDLGYIVIVLSNYDRPSARNIVNCIADMLIA
ncbi:MAG: beta-lactamase family protein [Anaerolineae bacterium]|nr:beta-lactamase family protein [Anaerolineae bacterium]